MSKDIDVLNTFLLAGIPEIISKEEFDDVKRAIQNLISRNEKLEKQMGKDLDVVYIKGVYDERDRWKNKIKELLKEAQEKYEVYKRESKDNENLKPQMWVHKGEVNMLEIILDKPRKLVTLD